MIDTNTTLEIAASPVKLLLMALGAAAFTVGGWFMIQATEGTGRYSADMIVLAGWAALVFFGACALLILWRLFTQRGAVVTLSPEGLRDIRVSPDVVAWPAIARLSTWSHSGQNVMIASLKPGEEEKLTLARWSRGANAKLGAEGLAIAASGLKIKHVALMDAAVAYAQRYGN